MTFEEWYEKEMMEGPDGGPKDLAKAAWKASQVMFALDVNAAITYRKVEKDRGILYAVYGTSSNNYADALEAKIAKLEAEL